MQWIISRRKKTEWIALPIESDPELFEYIHSNWNLWISLRLFVINENVVQTFIYCWHVSANATPHSRGAPFIQRFRIYSMLLDALQCSFIKFYRSFFVESNKAILPINCIIPISGSQCATECVAAGLHDPSTAANTHTNGKNGMNENVKILSFSASVRPAGCVDVFCGWKRIFGASTKFYEAISETNSFQYSSIWILFVSARCSCHGWRSWTLAYAGAI